ncbi:glucose-6-phosphate isomerase [Solibacillus sp. FSL K6-1523]|uniref:glucose-6-phosphate isomerase n=1 Tax=Solibacillus sp. FSL K6-1523 TaxID=2921471 RepID=UPI0030F59D75
MVNRLLANMSLDESLIGIHVNWSMYFPTVALIHRHLENVPEQLNGWVDDPLQQSPKLIQAINETAHEIQLNADVLVVVGIGGSYLGAKAVQDALTPYFGLQENGVEVLYVGHNLSGTYMKQLINHLHNKEVYMNVISKSGETMETMLAFRVLRNYMKNRYGNTHNNRIIVTTESNNGSLKKIADQNQYRTFAIPSNIGGRYSVLTPAGLLPIATAGIDINQLLEGAKDAAIHFKEEQVERNMAYRYAVIRYELYKKGYQMELLACFEPSLAKLQQWWQQLFAESEGKEQKGLFPSSVCYSSDLHSMGQFIQDGSPILFETLLHFNEVDMDYFLPIEERDEDALNYLTDKSFNEINTVAKEGVTAAHADAGVPIIQIQLKKLDAYHFGFLLYFFMKACAMSAYLLKVNPFDQPGVEQYKIKTLELLINSVIYKN